MATSSKFVPGLVVGLAIGALVGGVGGYVAHDLVEKPNPETMQQIEQAEQTQQGVDDFLNSLGAPDAANATPDAAGGANAGTATTP